MFVSSHFYGWIMSIGPDVKILDPSEVVEGYKDIIKRQINQYYKIYYIYYKIYYKTSKE